MLGAHSGCLAVPESQFKVEALRAARVEGGINVARAVREVDSSWRFQAWGLPAEVRASLVAREWSTYADYLRAIVGAYGDSVDRPDPRIWIDHTPENVRHLVTLFEAFPDARAVHIVRDGRAVAASVRQLDWGPNTMIGAARDWAENVGYGLGAETWLGAERIRRIRYEDLVADPEAALRDLCAWLEIDFEPEATRGDGYTRPAYYRYRAHRLIGRAPEAGRAQAWESELSPRQIELFESASGDLLRYLGYPLAHSGGERRVTGRDLVLSMAGELGMELVNRFRGRKRIRGALRAEDEPSPAD